MVNRNSYTVQRSKENEQNLLKEHNLKAQRKNRHQKATSWTPLQVWAMERNKGGQNG